jgi:hypothetical protein
MGLLYARAGRLNTKHAGSFPARAAVALSSARAAVSLEHHQPQHLRLALGWLDADAAPEEARLAGRQQRLAERPADGELVVRLLAEPGVDPGAAASVYTPLARAAELGHLEAARLLLDGGADPSHVAGDGATALWPKLPDLAQHLDWKSRLEP